MADTLVVACGALARELTVLARHGAGDCFDVRCIDARLHNRPAEIPGRVEEAIAKYGDGYSRIVIGYGDCGTGGKLDEIVASDPRLERLPGAHCYAFFSGLAQFDAMAEEELGTFWLTDFLVRHFDTMVIKSLKLDKHPELRDMYFGNYTRLTYLSQEADEELVVRAKEAAARLGLSFHHVHTGYGEVAQVLSFQEAAA